MRVLVTGAAGFVGGYLVSHLCDLGHEVDATSLALPERPESRPVRWEAMDLTDAAAVRKYLAAVEPEGVVHCAAQASVGGSWDDPVTTYRSNIEGTGNLLEAAKDLKPRMVLVGSAQQYVRPRDGKKLTESSPQRASSPYGLTKIAQELMGRMYLDRYGVPVMFTRSFNHTGPGQSSEYAVGSFCSQIARLERAGGGEMHVGNLEARRDFLDVRDVVQAYALLLEGGTPGEAYNICSGEAVRIGDLLDKLLNTAGLAGAVRISRESHEVSSGSDLLVGDPAKVQAAVGWAPRIPLDRSLAETLDWYRSYSEES
ncbi:MAG TPA: GDP-mannose 4,6-dehydratase [Actinomycetota bacterium]|nr:GDP-mannose 4,6-dehydratase [Actinomycetota bacterium]